ncbi:hypothetical protein HYR54_09945 [Candidatus Acetothermia bacterium]|nr:hypothetical protein [Candidatus Acetothermia bacterium]
MKVKKVNGVFFSPKKLIDADLEEALREIEEGRVIGPFQTAKAAIKALILFCFLNVRMIGSSSQPLPPVYPDIPMTN